MTRAQNGGDRGSAEERRYRKSWLLRRFGNGIEAPCLLRISPMCERKVSWATMNIDRLICGIAGGTYAHGNIIPACWPCNRKRLDKPLRHVMSRRRVETLLRRLDTAGERRDAPMRREVRKLVLEARP